MSRNHKILYKGKMIAYGMGDFLNDYEGIVGQGYEDFRDDLCCLYVPTLDKLGNLINLELIPGKIKHLKVQRATDPSDVQWLVQTFREQGQALGTSCDTIVDQHGHVTLKIVW
jgi:poly-gamma-glutamate synthesis protein (capsule biosynthesis protein)